MSVRRAQSEISSYEFAEWSVFNSIDPPGEIRADIRTALIRQTLIQCHGDKDTRIPPLKELMIDFWGIVKRPGTESVVKKLQQWLSVKRAAKRTKNE